jgi:hypothetical protein
LLAGKETLGQTAFSSIGDVDRLPGESGRRIGKMATIRRQSPSHPMNDERSTIDKVSMVVHKTSTLAER